jgi:F-type H+-transporting ATPase subunit gamma
MANSRDIKRRIKSVLSTQKITRAMKMVAASKVKKAENALRSSMPYSYELLDMLEKLFLLGVKIEKNDNRYEKAIDNYPELLRERKINTVGILVVTSDKGLAGAYNANVVRKTIARIKELEESGINAKLFVIGNKGHQALKRGASEILKFYTKLPALPNPSIASVIAEDLAESLLAGIIDKIEIITTHFKSSLSYQVQKWDVLPIVISKKSKNKAQTQSEMIFEPNTEIILQKIIPLYISNRIFHAIIEAATSEQAARMQAMSSATSNASDMIRILTIEYNKSRQASITQELLEVLNGAEALKR